MQGLRVSQSQVYQRDVGILKQYTPTLYKLVHMRTLRASGFEEAGDRGKKNTAGNTCKLDQSLSRTKAKIYELAICNPWEYFVTLTLSADGHDRYDLGAFQKQLAKWLNNYNTRQGTSIKYLLIPEPHKDGAWHFHGLFMGLPADHLTRNEHGYLDWLPYREKFGYASLAPIRDFTACAKYITKYITKELQDTRIALNDHMYYASKGLQRASEVYRDQIRQTFTPDFENEHCRVKQYDNLSDAMQPFCDDALDGTTADGVYCNNTEARKLHKISCFVAVGSAGFGVAAACPTTEQNRMLRFVQYAFV